MGRGLTLVSLKFDFDHAPHSPSPGSSGPGDVAESGDVDKGAGSGNLYLKF